MEPIVNRVAESEIEVFDLGEIASEINSAEFDIAPLLHNGLVLREKDFRQSLKQFEWSELAGKDVFTHCSTDAIIPVWSYMLIGSYLENVGATAHVGPPQTGLRAAFAKRLTDFDWERYRDRIVVVKGCGTANVPEQAYVDAMVRLKSVAKKVMYGEPCSSVLLWRKPVLKPDGRLPGVKSATAPPSSEGI